MKPTTVPVAHADGDRQRALEHAAAARRTIERRLRRIEKSLVHQALGRRVLSEGATLAGQLEDLARHQSALFRFLAGVATQ